MMRLLLSVLLVSLGSTVVAPSSAHAGEAEARSFFAEGRQKRLAGACEQAVPLFRKALETYPDGLGSLRNLAECEEELQRFASARRSYWDLRLAAMRTSDPKYAGWDSDATEAHARLKDKVARVIITVRGPKTAQVTLNGAPFDPRLWGESVEQDSGPINVVLRDGSSNPPAQTLVLLAGQTYEVSLVSTRTALDDTPPADPRPQPAVADASAPESLRVASYVSFGIAGASGIGLAVSIAMRQSSLASVEDGCEPRDNGFACPSELEGEVASGETSSALVNVFAVTSAVSAAAAIGLLAASFAYGTDDTSSVALFAVPTAGGLSLGFAGAF